MSLNNRMSDELPREVVAALRQNKKIEAIKLLRESRNLGLKEAKDIIDRYDRPEKAEYRALKDQGSFFIGRVIFVLVATSLLGFVVYLWLSAQ